MNFSVFVNNVYHFGIYHFFDLYIEINHFATLGEMKMLFDVDKFNFELLFTQIHRDAYDEIYDAC